VQDDRPGFYRGGDSGSWIRRTAQTFSDGTLLEARASLKSYRPKDGSGGPPDPARNGERDFYGERRRNDTHVSTTDPEAVSS
jgi:hypothetical protein